MSSLGTETPRKEGFGVKYNFSYYLPPPFPYFLSPSLYILHGQIIFRVRSGIEKKSGNRLETDQVQVAMLKYTNVYFQVPYTLSSIYSYFGYSQAFKEFATEYYT